MVLKYSRLSIGILLLLSSCSGGEDQGTMPTSSTIESADLKDTDLRKGEELYKLHCIACHGQDGKLGIGGSSDLSSSELDTVEIMDILNNGRKGMPAFKDILSNEKNVRSVTRHVLELRK
jgi:cytochrome c6